VLSLEVQPGNLQDRDGGKQVLEKAQGCLQHIWADNGYSGALQAWAKAQYGWELEIIRRPPRLKTFQVLPKRWIVERTFAWLNKYRLLAKEYELTLKSSASDLYLALSHRMLRWLAP
jgi:putative transposase